MSLSHNSNENSKEEVTLKIMCENMVKVVNPISEIL